VDGRPWRTVPDRVVVSCGLAADVELTRPILRRLRAELRDAEALAAAGRVLRRRDVSRHALEERMMRAGMQAGARERALNALAQAGALDDQRLAERRAAALTERGWGDAAIRLRLEGEGLRPDDVETAIGHLSPESERAARLVARTPDRRKAWSLLARRGFDPEVVAEAIPPLDGDDPGGLG
jgi:SOS response regulatory protein OraA/RecX